MFLMMEQEKNLILLPPYFLYVVYDGQEKKLILLQHYFLHVVYDRKEKKLILIQHYFLYVAYDGATDKNSFCYNLNFCMFSMMEQEKKLILL